MKPILYIDMDNVLVDFKSGIDALSSELKSAYQNNYDECPNIFSLMKPMDGAIEAFHLLSEHFDTYILSTAPWNNPSAWHDKLLWVKHHLGKTAHKRLILSHHKNLNHGDFLIDDRTANGVDRINGKHNQFGTIHFPAWQSVTNYLMGKINEPSQKIEIKCGDLIIKGKCIKVNNRLIRVEMIEPYPNLKASRELNWMSMMGGGSVSKNGDWMAIELLKELYEVRSRLNRHFDSIHTDFKNNLISKIDSLQSEMNDLNQQQKILKKQFDADQFNQTDYQSRLNELKELEFLKHSTINDLVIEFMDQHFKSLDWSICKDDLMGLIKNQNRI